MIRSKLFHNHYKQFLLYCKNYSNFAPIQTIVTNPVVGQTVLIKGWIKALRKMKSNLFLDVNDGSCNDKLQVVLPHELKSENLNWGASIEVNGILVRSTGGQLEVSATNIKVIGSCPLTGEFPFAPRKSYPPDVVRQHLHLRPRTSKMSSLLRVRHGATLAVHNYFNSKQFINIHTPILTSNDCEGAGEVFIVKPDNQQLLKVMNKQGIPLEDSYFDSKVYLTVSGQLHLEAAVHGLSKVYTIGPTFRAENSRSTLHLAEFYMLEAEFAFSKRIEDLLKFTESMIKSITRDILNGYYKDIANISDGRDLSNNWLDETFSIITYDDAIRILNDSNSKFKTPVSPDKGLAKEHELYLVQNNNNVPVFVINWPNVLKPFYMKSCDNNATKVAAFDLLVPNVGELAGGSLREDNYNTLKEKLNGTSNLKWYLDLRKFGGVPTAGFGMGFERFLQLILGIPNIKDVIPFPRWTHNCSL